MNKKRTYWVLRLLASLLICAIIYIKIDLRQSLQSIHQLGLITLVALLLNWLGAIAIPSLIIWVIANLDKSTRLRDFFVISHVNRFYSLALPSPVVTGARYLQYREIGITNRHSILILIANKSLNIIIALLTIIVSASYMLSTGPRDGTSNFLQQSIYLSTAVLFSSLVVYLFITFIIHLNKHKNNKFKKFNKFAQAIRDLTLKKVIQALLLAFIGSVLLTTCQFLVAIDLSLDLNFSEVFWSRSILSLILMIPFSIGGLGFRDLGLIATLAVFGIASHDAAFIALVLLSFQFFHGLVGFILEQVVLAKRIRDENTH